MASPGTGDDRQAGFTLLETLVALVVLGFLVAGLAQGLRAAIAASEAQGRQLATRGEFDAADHMLRTLVARMSPGGLSGEKPTLIGTSSTVTFTTTLPQAANALLTPEADVTLAMDDAHQAQLLWRPHYRRLIRPPPPPSAVPLLRDVDRLELDYWEAGQGWRPDWNGTQLPKLIRIRVVFTRKSGRTAPAIVIMPMRDRWRQ